MSIQWVNCGKTADWIWMPFGVVSGVCRGMSVLDGVGDYSTERGILMMNVGHPIVTSWGLLHSCAKVCEMIELRLQWSFHTKWASS